MCLGWNEYPPKTGGYTGILRDTPDRIRGLAVFTGVWLKG